MPCTFDMSLNCLAYTLTLGLLLLTGAAVGHTRDRAANIQILSLTRYQLRYGRNGRVCSLSSSSRLQCVFSEKQCLQCNDKAMLCRFNVRVVCVRGVRSGALTTRLQIGTACVAILICCTGHTTRLCCAQQHRTPQKSVTTSNDQKTILHR